MSENKLPTRKPNRYHNFDYSTHGCYFVTICINKNTNISLWDRKQTCEWIKSTERHFTSFASGATHFEFLDYDKLLEKLPLSSEGKIVDRHIKNLSTVYSGVYVQIYSVMPDHIHLLIHNQAKNDNISLQRIIKQFKIAVSKEIGLPLWQKSFYDTIITKDIQYDNIFEYIYRNPLKYLHRTNDVKKMLGEI